MNIVTHHQSDPLQKSYTTAIVCITKRPSFIPPLLLFNVSNVDSVTCLLPTSHFLTTGSPRRIRTLLPPDLSHRYYVRADGAVRMIHSGIKLVVIRRCKKGVDIKVYDDEREKSGRNEEMKGEIYLGYPFPEPLDERPSGQSPGSSSE